MTTSFENQTIEELKRKRHQLYHYINKINKELERRGTKLTIKERIDDELDNLELHNSHPIKRFVKKMSNLTKNKVKSQIKLTPKTNTLISSVRKNEDKRIKIKKNEQRSSKKNKITIKVMKQAFDNKGIKYKSSSKKSELEDLMRKNNLVRYVESLM